MAMRNERRQAAWDKTSGHCWYCGRVLCGDDELKEMWAQHAQPKGIESKAARFLNSIEMQIDHADPKSRGGDETAANLLPACAACNSEKGAQSIDEYRARLMLNRGRPPTPFYGEPSIDKVRDWLIVASPVRRRDPLALAAFLGHEPGAAT